MEAFALQGRLNSTVERMKRDGESEDEIRKGERLLSELKTARDNAKQKMERRIQRLPSEGRSGQSLNKWMQDEDYIEKVKSVNQFINQHRQTNRSPTGRGTRKRKKGYKKRKTKGHKRKSRKTRKKNKKRNKASKFTSKRTRRH